MRGEKQNKCCFFINVYVAVVRWYLQVG